MRRGIAALVAMLIVPAAALAAIKPGTSQKVSSASLGTSGGDEPYVVSLAPRPGGAIVAYLTRLNLSDTPPGDFIVRSLDASGVPASKGVTYGARDDIHVAAAVLDESGEKGLAVWDDHPDGEDVDAGPLWTQGFTAETAAPIGKPAKIFNRTELHAAARLGDGYLIAHERFSSGLLLQQLDAQGAVTGEEVPLDFFSVELVAAADGESVLAYEAYRGGKTKIAVIGRDRFLAEPGRVDAAGGVSDVVAAPGGGWLLVSRAKADKRTRVQSLSTEGVLGSPTVIDAPGTKAFGAELAFEDRRGLLVWAGRKPCDGFAAVALRASGKPLSDTPTPVPAAPACGANAVYDLELSAAGPRRFVLGWTRPGGDKGHYVYTTGIKR